MSNQKSKSGFVGDRIVLLHVDDEEHFLDLTKEYINYLNPNNVEVFSLSNPEHVLNTLEEKKIDVIVSDYRMAEMNGLELLQLLKDNKVEIPFIIFTGKGREEVAIKALNLGADYYLKKGGDTETQFSELIHIVQRVVNSKRIEIALKESQDALRKNEERYRRLFDFAPISLVQMDLSKLKNFVSNLKQSGVVDFQKYFEKHPEDVTKCAKLIEIIDVNQKTLEMLEAENKEELLRNAAEVFCFESQDFLKKELLALAKGKKFSQTEAFNRTLTGKTIHVNLSLSADPGHEETLSRVIISSLDITVQKKIENALQESESRYKRLFEESPISIWEEDFSELKRFFDGLRKNGISDFQKYFKDNPEKVHECFSMIKVIDVNKATLNLYKAKSKEHFFENLNKFFFSKTPTFFKDELLTLLKGKTTFKCNDTAKTIEGKWFHSELSLLILPGCEETWSKVIVSIDDITERKIYEEKLRLASETLQNINDILSHDLLSELFVVKGLLDLIRDSPEEDYYCKASRIIDKSVILIRRMKEIQHLISQEDALTPYEIRKTIEEVLERYSFEKVNLSITGNPKVIADHALNSVIDNIIRNAFYHSKTDQIDISVENKGKNCEIRISDYGKGIPDELKRKFFHQDITNSKLPNMGLGLFIVKKVVDRYGGKVWVEDNSPKGTVFILLLKRSLNDSI